MGSDDSLIIFRRVPEDAGIDRERLRRFAETLSARLAKGREFSCRLTGDAELRRLNKEFLGKDYATDVLSFPSDDGETIGDLAISRQRAAAQAKRFRHDINEEIEILLLHGVLHLMGFDHEHDAGEMAQ